MHVIREKKTAKILYIDYSHTESASPGEQVFPDFNHNSMEIGWTPEPYIPAWFEIDKKGMIQELGLDEAANRGLYQLEPGQKLIKSKIVDKDKTELVDEGLVKLDDIKQQLLRHYDAMSFYKRNELIPDYKLNNAALGVYDERRMADYKVTIQAFREESKRIAGLINEATNVADIEAIEESFPISILTAD